MTGKTCQLEKHLYYVFNHIDPRQALHVMREYMNVRTPPMTQIIHQMNEIGIINYQPETVVHVKVVKATTHNKTKEQIGGRVPPPFLCFSVNVVANEKEIIFHPVWSRQFRNTSLTKLSKKLSPLTAKQNDVSEKFSFTRKLRDYLQTAAVVE